MPSEYLTRSPEYERLAAELEAVRTTRDDFHRELRDLQHEVAKACQASGTMLTDLQPEAMSIVLTVCKLHPILAEESRELAKWKKAFPPVEPDVARRMVCDRAVAEYKRDRDLTRAGTRPIAKPEDS
jgi:hypothetical protein